MEIPRAVVLDNGKQLISREVKDLFGALKIEHHKVALYAPAQNGLVERFNLVIGEKLKESVEGGYKITSVLSQLLFDYRSTPHSITNISHFEIMFGRKMRNNLMFLSPGGGERKEMDMDMDLVKRNQDSMKRVKRMEEARWN